MIIPLSPGLSYYITRLVLWRSDTADSFSYGFDIGSYLIQFSAL